jgi:hypothetical protein
MITVRTCGSGVSHNDERLQRLKEMVNYFDLSMKIFKLHDHKGMLTVYWFVRPTLEEQRILKHAWEFFCEYEISHVLVIINEKPL